jgi:LPS O-antigen subunit length determinant protein (WzzB/FepE family)
MKESEINQIKDELTLKHNELLEDKRKEMEMRMNILISMKDNEIKKLKEQLNLAHKQKLSSPDVTSVKRTREDMEEDNDLPENDETAHEGVDQPLRPEIKKQKQETNSAEDLAGPVVTNTDLAVLSTDGEEVAPVKMEDDSGENDALFLKSNSNLLMYNRNQYVWRCHFYCRY